MKKQTFKSLAMAAVLALATSNVQAQGFFKKLSKGIDKATRAIDKGTKELDKVTTNLTGDTNATQDNTSSATDSTKINKEYLIDDAPHYTVKKVYETATHCATTTEPYAPTISCSTRTTRSVTPTRPRR